MIKELLSETTIEVNFKATSWESAVRESGELLKKAGKVNSLSDIGILFRTNKRKGDKLFKELDKLNINYTINELGPYIVISKNIAMPHARPEEGSNGIGVSLITLKTPINFGNKENDPVKAVVGFSAKDNKSHIELLSELMQLFEDEDFHKIINKANSKEEIKKFILEKDFK
jgi:mannitol/fructose-specific phosphotransferase system IIA component (Ntr-type)